ncbi:hypothetical protein K3495_g11935 [Podosphaera aphanis]|nr:hypothetical protein K3495_g11935 [Podosphaera aphanis]
MVNADSNLSNVENVENVEPRDKPISSYVTDWGKSSLPPTLLATLLTALHLRPFQMLPMVFPPVFLFSSYLNLQHFTRESAGLTAAWSGVYLLMARRRKYARGLGLRRRLYSRFGARGLTRGLAMGLALANVVGGGLVYSQWWESDLDEEAANQPS